VEPLRFDGQVVVVVGGAGGLGSSHARDLAARGAAVVIADAGFEVEGDGADPGPADSVAEAIVAEGGQAVADPSDLRDPAAGEAVVANAVRKFGRIDAVVCSAGIVTFPGSVANTTLVDIQQHLAVEPATSFNVIHAAWPMLERQGYGRIVLTVSSAVFGVASGLGYAAAKGATLALGKGLARAGETCGIRVNVIAPYGFTREMTHFARPAAAVEAKRQTLDPKRVSALVTVLAHQECPVSGEFFAVGGGRVIRVFYAETSGYTDRDLDAETVLDQFAQIMSPEHIEAVKSNKQFVDRFYDGVPGFREEEARFTRDAASS
jgi:NAD(P)-dependent dehydrogenase (short-subunit alcohol dehydrogenase family)